MNKLMELMELTKLIYEWTAAVWALHSIVVHLLFPFSFQQ